ncbi:redoxin domain-containing protein [Aporhodopirellula aestuarii]|uniref:Redoxin domain-containing protein n=1 Tax=Aporhodopirellula aestuarii TaxID=2950107 RepID=A0ABT0U9G7_9BACT|nr:redoxin domain-containing protein [Aporhodopirellula aestuarii]MCM2373001.1 redoxin domain-containing protein [Aporhodopirellula aestuarii]
MSFTASAAEPPAEAASDVTSQPFLLQMIRDDAVQQELRLDESKIKQVDVAISEVDPRWWVSRIQPREQQQAEVRELTQHLRKRLSQILEDDQSRRLAELERQAHGTRMVRRADVVTGLGISPTQQAKFEKLFAETDAEVASIQKDLTEKTIDTKQAAQEIATEQRNERQGLLEILTPDQQAKIGPLVGATFDFSQVKRTYPRAPDFITEGSQWLGPESVRMPDLRGKVVAVFFYAFQCINCQRNFPHYKAWHTDMADDGLVIIGIQRPETAAERDINRVKEALKKDGFEFPVLFDQDSNNWNAWGNTMWPTTYLIDKKGFIRRWWQGEMNWQGTPGEQQMRESIVALLAE